MVLLFVCRDLLLFVLGLCLCWLLEFGGFCCFDVLLLLVACIAVLPGLILAEFACYLVVLLPVVIVVI